MTQSQQGGWHVPDQPGTPAGGPPAAPHPNPPMPPRPAPAPGYPHPQAPAAPPPPQAPLPPRGRLPTPQRQDRYVAPPVPVVDPPEDAEDEVPLPPLPTLPPGPGPHSRAPELTRAKRIPTDLPLVIRPKTIRWLLLFLLPALALCTPAVLLFAWWGLPVPGLFAAVITVGAVVALFGFHLGDWLWAGPLLAADERGVWVRAQRFPVRAVQLPWELIEEIHPKRWVLDKALCIVTRDARAGRLTGVWGAIDQAKTSAFFRVPLVASIAMSNTPTDRALRTLTELSHGRSTISSKVSRAKRQG